MYIWYDLYKVYVYEKCYKKLKGKLILFLFLLIKILGVWIFKLYYYYYLK